MKDFFNKETLDNIKQFCAENKKYVGVAGVLVGLILILIVVVAGGNNGRQSNTEAGSQTEISVKDFEFEKDYTNDAKDDISTLLADYYKAYVGDDLDTLGKLATPMSDNEKSYIGVVSQYYESVNYITIQPKLDVQLLTPNPYSRPQKALEKVNGIVVHYTANPGTSARQNRDYFNGLAETKKTKASSHFVIGLEGEIVQCIPCNEISYASNNRNSDTISIECCIEDETGKFNDSTYQSLIELTTWLMGRYDLSADDVIRHYDVTGKKCPLYFVEHEDAWEQFHKDLDTYIEENGVPKEEASQN